MILSGTCDTFKEDLLRGVHQPGDDYRIALYAEDADLDRTSTRYTARGEVDGDGYDAGGQRLRGFQVGREGKVAFLAFEDPVWPKATIQARGALIYNATRDNRSVAVVDFGAVIQSRQAAFTVEFPPATAAEALIRVL